MDNCEQSIPYRRHVQTEGWTSVCSSDLPAFSWSNFDNNKCLCQLAASPFQIFMLLFQSTSMAAFRDCTNCQASIGWWCWICRSCRLACSTVGNRTTDCCSWSSSLAWGWGHIRIRRLGWLSWDCLTQIEIQSKECSHSSTGACSSFQSEHHYHNCSQLVDSESFALLRAVDLPQLVSGPLASSQSDWHCHRRLYASDFLDEPLSQPLFWGSLRGCFPDVCTRARTVQHQECARVHVSWFYSLELQSLTAQNPYLIFIVREPLSVL